MPEFITLKEIDQTTDFIRSKLIEKPRVGLILGSGLGALAESIESPVGIPFGEIPNWPISTVLGHAGKLVCGRLENQPVMVLQGRAHFYEGYRMDQVTLPIRVMQRLGVEAIVLTNAAGAINEEYQPGDVMLLVDHIGLIGMVGLNPLNGPNLSAFGERFPDMSQVYDRELIALARRVANKNQITLHEGVYVCLSGPSFETPADLRFLKIIGADAVGMSTVPEAIVARHGKTRVLGISGISNKANLDGNTLTTHEEVLEAGKIIVPKMLSLIRGILKEM